MVDRTEAVAAAGKWAAADRVAARAEAVGVDPTEVRRTALAPAGKEVVACTVAARTEVVEVHPTVRRRELAPADETAAATRSEQAERGRGKAPRAAEEAARIRNSDLHAHCNPRSCASAGSVPVLF